MDSCEALRMVDGVERVGPRLYVGIDNGTSGSIGVLVAGNMIPARFLLPPVKSEFKQTRKGGKVTRINYPEFLSLLLRLNEEGLPYVVLERPFTGTNSNTVASGARAFEAQLIALEETATPYRVIDSRSWQRVFLPSGISGKELKKASLEAGCREWPGHAAEIRRHGDADGLWIAAWARKEGL